MNDCKVLAFWNESVHLVNNHYTLNIPFKERPPQLPYNKSMALHRLRLTTKRFQRDIEMHKAYSSGMTELIEKGYAELVPDIERNDCCVMYIPHHAVVHPKKPGKLRIVWDCAAKVQGTSLNDKVYQGPDLTNSLVGVLVRFRQGRIAFMADIEGMFNQVHVEENDRDALRFLWWRDGDCELQPQEYRMTTNLFGGVWSPSCANFALRRCASDNADNFDKLTTQTINRNFYVDDCLKSVDSEFDAVRLTTQLKEVLLKGGFNLTKFVSNSRRLLSTIPEKDQAKGLSTISLATLG